MKEAIRKAEILIEALPYIKKFHKKVIVIKYGGSILADKKVRQGVLEDVVFLNYMGLCPVLVHGGGPNISKRLHHLGHQTRFFEGVRITDEQALGIVCEELKKLNHHLMQEVEKMGGQVSALFGNKNRIITVKKKKAAINLGRVGRIVKINPRPIIKALNQGMIAVVSPMGADEKKRVYNVNADEAASALAGSLRAEKLVFLTNIDGIMRDPEDRTSFMSTLNAKQAERLINDQVIQHGMIPKVKSSIEALKGGVKKTHIVNARIPRGLLLEIFTDKGIGTEIVK